MNKPLGLPTKGGVCLSIALLSAAGAPEALAGGPTAATGNGAFLRWDNSQPIRYRFDPGKLGGLSNAAASDLVRDAFGRWDAVTTADLTTQEAGMLNVDVDLTNYMTFFNAPRADNSVIFDDDGSITDDVFGQGSKGFVLGFASPLFANGGFFTYGVAVLNGALSIGSQTVTHELGHLLGLDHTAANRQFTSGGPDLAFVPVMYPILFSGQTSTPHRDDVAWLSWLYPTPEFTAQTGVISGQALRRIGLPLQGANVVAVQALPDGLGGFAESKEEVVSCVSDFLITLDGSYRLPGLTPGDYFVFVEPLPTFLVGGSGVGPFDSRFAGFPKDYFNGEFESGDALIDDPAERILVTVAPGAEAPDIELISNEDPPSGDPLQGIGDDDAALLTLPDDFAFPIFGRVVKALFVNSDGNVTFPVEDGSSGARSVNRFLSGPIRIAPLFTDLDPSAAGSVESTQAPGQFTIRWNGVPEFADEGAAPPNTFSMTLFSTGDVRFDYQAVSITAPQDPLAIVGISEGDAASAAAETRDFSASPDGLFPFQSGIYQSFAPGGFDLAGSSILFQAPKTRLFFPFYRGNQTVFSGFAATNYSSSEAVLTLESRSLDGTLSDFDRNPAVQTLAEGEQFAKVGTEIFGIPESVAQDEWVEILSSESDVSSFFLFGNGLSGPLTQLDGGVAISQQATELFFTRVYQGTAFPVITGLLQAETLFNVANPNDEEIKVSFSYFAPTGAQVFGTSMRTIPAKGVLREDFGELFDTADPVADGHVRAQVTQGPGAVGFELIQLPDSLLGLNAAIDASPEVLYSAQLANGGVDPRFNFTDVKLVNTSSQLRLVTGTATNEEGLQLGVFQVALTPNQALQERVSELFGLGSPLGAVTTGSITFEVDGSGVVGDVIFGDPVSGQSAAAAALQGTPFSEAVFSQVANGSTNPAQPTTDAFTGLALFNPGAATVQVTIGVFNPQGQLVGETTFPLGAGERLSDLIENLIPDTADQNGGYIRVSVAGGAIVAQQLFGNNSLTFLASVPPRIIQ